MDYYYSNAKREGYARNVEGDRIEEPIVGVRDIGTSVTEGRVGAFRDTIQGAIRSGANSVELALQMEGQPGVPAGTGSYGKDEREELREIAKANKINIMSVHTPSNIGNLSGFNPQQGFDDSMRRRELDEVKKAIDFASDTTDGSAVVIHTGEFARPISESEWAKDKEGNYLFKAYPEEPEKAVVPVVDKRTGKILTQVRKNQVVYRPTWLKNDNGEYIDYEGNVVDMKHRVPAYDENRGTFKVEAKKWDDFVKEARERNEEKEKKLGRSLEPDERISPEEAFLHAQVDSQIVQSRGWARYHAKDFKESLDNLNKLKKAKEFYDKLDESLPEDEKWKIMREDPEARMRFGNLIPSEYKPIPDILKEKIEDARYKLRYIKDTSSGYEQQEKEAELLKTYAEPVSKYAKKKSMQSYIEAGIYAMEKTDHAKTKKPIFVAPENIFPEMGYGSHPDELIDIVQTAREKMVDALTEEKIPDPTGKMDENGNPKMVKNPYYKGYSRKRAEKEAKEHIKATFDTSHMGMWWKYFEPRPGETEMQRKNRFDSWYKKQVKKLHKAGVLGHIHAVDSFGYGDPHLPVGEGNLPVKTALEYLKEHGYTGTMMSEAHGHGKGGQGRQMLKTWQNLGSAIGNIYHAGAPGERVRFGDVHQSYFGKHRAPYTIFGAYAPSNDWTLWTQVPLE